MILFHGRNNNNIIGGFLLMTLMGMSGPAFAQVEAQPVDAQGETRWAVNFNDTDIQEVIKSIAGLTGKTFIIDPKVRGPIKVINTKPLNAKGQIAGHTMALAKPPPSEPGAGVDWVNMAQSRAAKPLDSSTNKIHSKTNRPKPIADMDKVKPTRLDNCMRL